MHAYTCMHLHTHTRIYLSSSASRAIGLAWFFTGSICIVYIPVKLSLRCLYCWVTWSTMIFFFVLYNFVHEMNNLPKFFTQLYIQLSLIHLQIRSPLKGFQTQGVIYGRHSFSWKHPSGAFIPSCHVDDCYRLPAGALLSSSASRTLGSYTLCHAGLPDTLDPIPSSSLIYSPLFR